MADQLWGTCTDNLLEPPYKASKKYVQSLIGVLSGSMRVRMKGGPRSYHKSCHRLEELEEIAKAFKGVDKVYAIQAGREVRVFVSPEAISDIKAHNLARDIAKKIEEELKYPGEIKINVIREMRVTEYAR